MANQLIAVVFLGSTFFESSAILSLNASATTVSRKFNVKEVRKLSKGFDPRILRNSYVKAKSHVNILRKSAKEMSKKKKVSSGS